MQKKMPLTKPNVAAKISMKSGSSIRFSDDAHPPHVHGRGLLLLASLGVRL